MRRLMVLIAAFVFLTACGHGKARAGIPTPNNSNAANASKSELEGLASYYAEPYNGRKTANGETFDSYNAMTAAHKTLPFNTVVRVKNMNNGEEVDVRINDRGPFVKGRVIDLSMAAAKEIDLVRPGVAPVKLKVLKGGSPTTIPSVKPAAPPVVPAPNVNPVPLEPVPLTPVPVAAEPEIAEAPVPAQPDLPTPIAAAPPEGPVYGVQVGAFQSKSAAEQLRDDLATRYSDVTIQPIVAEQTMYRVRVGRSPDMDSAEKLAKRLRDERFNTIVVRLN